MRPETCQSLFTDFKAVCDSTRMRIPFGLAQIGKAFRNEITARQFIFRTRELEQMEMQYFLSPEAEMIEYEKLRQARWQFYLDLGIKPENLQWHKHENLVFYAKEAYDIEYRFPFGFKELEGIHARGNYDLTQHGKFSGHDFTYTDPATSEKYIPHIIESSVGPGRMMLAVLTEFYSEEEVDGETRVVMKFPSQLAPYKVAVLPLSKKENLSSVAQNIAQILRGSFMVDYDETQSIGKRYRRQDEIGTPFCVTVDFDTLGEGEAALKDTVTVRERDSMKQERIAIADLEGYLSKRLG